MNRLKCNGKPMLTSIQFFQEANLRDLLRQKEEFLSFASSHLNLEGMNHPIFALQEISRRPELLEKDAWLENLREDVCDEPACLQELDAVWQEVQRYFSETEFSEEKAGFLAAVALSVWIAKLEPGRWQQDSADVLLQAYLGKAAAQERVGSVRFAEDRLIELPLQKEPYAVPYCPEYPMQEGQKIVTYTIRAAAVGMFDSVILDLGQGRQRKIPRGERLLVNVVDDTIVCFLPNKISAGGTGIERRADGLISLNGCQYAGTQNVTTLAVEKETGLYFWADQGKLEGSYLDAHPKCGKYVQRIVEAALSGGYYYLLTANGTLDSNDPVRNQVDRLLASLGALREELKT